MQCCCLKIALLFHDVYCFPVFFLPDLETLLQCWTAWSIWFKKRSRWVFNFLLCLAFVRDAKSLTLHQLLCNWPLTSQMEGGVNIISLQWSIKYQIQTEIMWFMRAVVEVSCGLMAHHGKDSWDYDKYHNCLLPDILLSADDHHLHWQFKNDQQLIA